MRVQVYWNIAKRIWSVRDKTTGRVVLHLPALVLDDCKLKVQQGGRARVLREKQKNIHAFVEGDLVAEGTTPDAILGIFGTLPAQSESVTYNPYKHESFVVRATGAPIFTAPRAILTSVYVPNEGRKPEVLVCDPALAEAA